MNKEELLKPRYEVIASFPEMESIFNYKLNDIILQEEKHFFSINGMNCLAVREGFENFRHLFKPLHWWERRDVKDLPIYIGTINEKGKFNWVCPVVKYTELRVSEQGRCIISFTNKDGEYEEMEMQLWSTIPAIEAEYLEYLEYKKLHP